MSKSPIILWFRRDFRLSDHAALTAACSTGRPIIPLVIYDDNVQGLGAAPKWRWGLGAEHLGKKLKDYGSRLIFRSGRAIDVLQELVVESSAGAVFWSRLYDPDAVARDTEVKSVLKEKNIEARSFGGHLMFEPWTVETKTGGFYKVYTPFWNTVKNREVDAPLIQPTNIKSPTSWPFSDHISDWRLDKEMGRGTVVVRPFVQLGEKVAQTRLADFIENKVATYVEGRDIPAQARTSNLSENLALGEISPHQCWHAAMRAFNEGQFGAETFLKELVWREFAYHLMHHTPWILDQNWKDGWDAFPWNTNASSPEVMAWKYGRTGIQFVDAAMRELYVTGRMHNRGRMIVASYLTKHLLSHWRIGQEWFSNCLIDWDPASNAMGWQWSAGSGPDATPYFRVFNPVTQLDKFDKNRDYTRRWIAEVCHNQHSDALKFYNAIPLQIGLSSQDTYPEPIVAADIGRKRALTAYENREF